MKKNKKPACFAALLLAVCLCGGCGKDASAMVETKAPPLAEESSVPTGGSGMEAGEGSSGSESGVGDSA